MCACCLAMPGPWRLRRRAWSSTFTKDKDGKRGKGQWCLDQGIGVIFDDDDPQALMECRGKGLWVPNPKDPESPKTSYQGKTL